MNTIGKILKKHPDWNISLTTIRDGKVLLIRMKAYVKCKRKDYIIERATPFFEIENCYFDTIDQELSRAEMELEHELNIIAKHGTESNFLSREDEKLDRYG